MQTRAGRIQPHLPGVRQVVIAALAGLLALVMAGGVLTATGQDARLADWLREESPVVSSLRWKVKEWRNPPISPAEAGAGGPASDLMLVYPSGMATGPDGSVYLADRALDTKGRLLWRVTPSGTVEHIAGNGHRGRPRDGAVATATSLGSPEGIRVDDAGRVYIADSWSNVVVRVETDGTLTRLAGRAGPDGDFTGDGGPARDARLSAPFDVALDGAGNVYIADFGNHRIRMVTADGVIETVAGTGEPGYSGDGGPATAARLNGPYGVAVDNEGRLLIADSFNNVVRRVEHDGTIRTIAGTGERGYSGDGGPALEARFDAPQALFVDADDTIFIGDEHNHAVRALRPDGTIENVIGTGAPGFAEPGALAVEASTDDPEMVVRLGEDLLVVENEHGRVIRIDAEGRVGVFAGR